MCQKVKILFEKMRNFLEAEKMSFCSIFASNYSRLLWQNPLK